MVIELKKGYTIDSWYDKFTDSYITRLLDPEGNQIKDALYSGDIVGRNYDVQSIRDFFKTYMNDPNFNIDNNEDKEEVDDESFEEIDAEDSSQELENSEEYIEEAFDAELEKKARKTKKATKKSKLPALSKMSPIMPDYEAGISKFNAATADGNSGMASTTGSTGLGEAYMGRSELIKALKNMGFKYKFDKYSDKQLFRIYQERQKKLEKQKAEENIRERERAYSDNKRENAKDSYFKNGIEFESEDAAREYFGESMKEQNIKINEKYRVGKKIASDRLVRPKVSKSELSKVAQQILDDNGVLETVDDNTIYDLGPKTANKVLTILNDNGINSEVVTDSAGLCTIYLTESLESMNNKNKNESMNKKFYINDMHMAWDIEEDELKESLNESISKNGHNFNTITEGLHYFERKYFDECYRDAELEVMFESMRDKLSSEDVKKLGAFMNHAEDADEVLTYMKGLLSEDTNTEDINNESLTEDIDAIDQNEQLCYDFYKYDGGNPYICIMYKDEDWDGWDLYADVSINLDEPIPEDEVVLSHDLNQKMRQEVINDLAQNNSGDYVQLKPDWKEIILNMQKERGYKREEYTESLHEAVQRYSDVVPYEERGYWYFTKHGLGPGTIPDDLKVLDVVEDDNFGTYIKLDGILNTSELNYYDMIEKAPEGEY